MSPELSHITVIFTGGAEWGRSEVDSDEYIDDPKTLAIG
jgi:hypothetical protein